jgi:hypothetical protein
MDQEPIIAVGLLTRRDLNLLGPTFDRVFPVEDVPQFDELLEKIDQADSGLEKSRPMTDTIETRIEDDLFAIEEGFWLKGQDHFLENLDDECLLAFPQMGEMHGVKSREAVAATAATNAGRWRDLKISNRSMVKPAEGVAIISYRADVTRGDGEPYSALIGSGYAKRSDGWKLCFHQHSPV